MDPLDSTLRDFCGRCIEEFVKWSIKQTTPKQQEKSPTNMKSLFKRIYSLALHPSGFKRLGAALAFNNIYRQFRSDTSLPSSRVRSCCVTLIGLRREEKSLVEQFVFEVLVVFIECLALAHADERSLGNCLCPWARVLVRGCFRMYESTVRLLHAQARCSSAPAPSTI